MNRRLLVLQPRAGVVGEVADGLVMTVELRVTSMVVGHGVLNIAGERVDRTSQCFGLTYKLTETIVDAIESLSRVLLVKQETGRGQTSQRRDHLPRPPPHRRPLRHDP